MKLFGKIHHEPEQETLPAEQPAEEQQLVLSFDGDEALTPKEDAPELSVKHGATGTLPDREAILRAVAQTAEEEKPKEPVNLENVQLAVEEAIRAVNEKPELPEVELPDQSDRPEAPAETTQTPSVTYASMAEAMEKSGMKSPDAASRKQRSAIDDETLLAEIYALMGENPKQRKAEPAAKAEPDAKPEPAAEPEPVVRPEAVLQTPAAANPGPDDLEITIPGRSKPRETGAAEEPAFRPDPASFDRDLPRQPRPVEQLEDRSGAPGWLKGVFLLLISALLSGMTVYAVATDVIGNIF
jgi:hypothetical protein